MSSEFGSEPYPRIESQALELLAEQGVPDRDIEKIVEQVTRLSAGYRRPENKLADILSGEVVSIHQNAVILTRGSGALDRGGESGDCSEGTRRVTAEWANSTLHRHLGNVGMHPIYLEVATPRLFKSRWDAGNRIRSGHSVLALGNLESYVKKGDDTGFVLIDPTLGVIEPMVESDYRQTGYVVVPGVEERSDCIPVIAHDVEEGAMFVKSTAIQNLVLGIDEAAQFVYTLWFRARSNGPVAQVHVMDRDSSAVGRYDLDTDCLHITQDRKDQFEKSFPTLERIVEVLNLNPPEVRSEYEVDGNILKTNGKSFEMVAKAKYPIHKKVADNVKGLEYAAFMAAKAGGSFSLRMDEDTTNPSSWMNELASRH